uniref:NADH-ubiquinone oxidoreductase chain 1 n=1 Tax=Margaritifera margaritifera TaxID=102329 RepID=S4S282_PINMG|nr:NADH dehydrogenase subunit 1 [Pinctada margaritifera]
MCGCYIDILIVFLGVLMGVAYFTLLERKALGSFHLRKGPCKVGWLGICQPLADAVKLFSKEFFCPYTGAKWAFFLAPGAGIFTMCLTWSVLYPNPIFVNTVSLDVLIFLAITSLNVYVVMVAGWASNSKYASLASNRGFAQAISYEVVLTLISFCFVMLSKSFNFMSISGSPIQHGFVVPLLSLCWLVVILAEVNRSPFDFAEAESELVSGYSVEYGGGGFAMLFIAEYGNILFMSYFTAILLLPCDGGDVCWWVWNLYTFLKGMLVAYGFLWIRSALPRYRYDLLMLVCWKSVLPGALVCFLGCFWLAAMGI